MGTKYTAVTANAAVIDDATIANGGVTTSTEITNATAEDAFANVNVVYEPSSTYTAGSAIYLYIDYEGLGGYENRIADAQLIGVIVGDGTTGVSYKSLTKVPIGNRDFKVIAHNDFDNSVTVDMTMDVDTYFVE